MHHLNRYSLAISKIRERKDKCAVASTGILNGRSRIFGGITIGIPQEISVILICRNHPGFTAGILNTNGHGVILEMTNHHNISIIFRKYHCDSLILFFLVFLGGCYGDSMVILLTEPLNTIKDHSHTKFVSAFGFGCLQIGCKSILFPWCNILGERKPVFIGSQIGRAFGIGIQSKNTHRRQSQTEIRVPGPSICTGIFYCDLDLNDLTRLHLGR